MQPKRLRLVLAAAAALALTVPTAVLAANGFEDVPESNVFRNDIAWLAEADVTRGCNPPQNTRFCPEDSVTRQQMAAFMHRLAMNRVVDAGRLQGMTAAEIIAAAGGSSGGSLDADTLDGRDSTFFAGAADLPKVETVTESLSCGGRGFFPSNSAEMGAIGNSGRYVTEGGSAVALQCAISPPQGARLVSATFVVSDSSTSQGAGWVEVRSYRLDGSDPRVHGAFGSNVDPISTAPEIIGLTTIEVPITGDHTVDPANRVYELRAVLGSSSPAMSQYVAIYGATLTYEIDRLAAP